MASSDGLDQMVDTQIMKTVARAVVNDWKMLARELDLAEEVIIEIQTAALIDGVREMCYQAINKWKQKKGDKATIRMLANHLEMEGRTDVALEITKQAQAHNSGENAKDILMQDSEDNKPTGTKKKKKQAKKSQPPKEKAQQGLNNLPAEVPTEKSAVSSLIVPNSVTKSVKLGQLSIESQHSLAHKMIDDSPVESPTKTKDELISSPTNGEITKKSRKPKGVKKSQALMEFKTPSVDAPVETATENDMFKRNSVCTTLNLEQYRTEEQHSLSRATTVLTQVGKQTKQNDKAATDKPNTKFTTHSQKPRGAKETPKSNENSHLHPNLLPGRASAAPFNTESYFEQLNVKQTDALTGHTEMESLLKQKRHTVAPKTKEESTQKSKKVQQVKQNYALNESNSHGSTIRFNEASAEQATEPSLYKQNKGLKSEEFNCQGQKNHSCAMGSPTRKDVETIKEYEVTETNAEVEIANATTKRKRRKASSSLKAKSLSDLQISLVETSAESAKKPNLTMQNCVNESLKFAQFNNEGQNGLACPPADRSKNEGKILKQHEAIESKTDADVMKPTIKNKKSKSGNLSTKVVTEAKQIQKVVAPKPDAEIMKCRINALVSETLSCLTNAPEMFSDNGLLT